MSDVITEDGEVISNVPAMIDTATVSAIVRAEIDTQVSTAKQYPRSLKKVISNITTLATLDETTAEECLYALVRKGGGDSGNKPIEGPSIRLAEIAAQCYGNCRIDARVVSVNRQEKYVEAVGIFHDLESNMASSATVRRRISTKNGRVFSDDMIVVTGNAACAIAKRNAILAGIPKGVYRQAYLAAREIVAGNVSSLTANRDKAIKAFAAYGVTKDQILETLGVESEADIKVDHIATLRGMFATIKNGESTVEEMFAKPGPTHEVVQNPLSDDPAPQKERAATNPETPQQPTPPFDQAAADGDRNDGSQAQAAPDSSTSQSGAADSDSDFPGDQPSKGKRDLRKLMAEDDGGDL